MDNIDNYLLNIASEVIAAPIRHILNCSFATSTFPDQWKIAKLRPIPKDGKKPFEDENSRPIDLSPYNQNFDLGKSRQIFHHSLKEHHKISNIPKFRCEML